MSLKRRDWTLLAIAAAKGKPLSPVQLQKSLFLLGREMPNEVGTNFYDFEPYNFGPFDVTVYTDAERLEDKGLVLISRPAHQRYNEYAATAEGLARAKALRAQAPKRALRYLETIVDWARSLSFSDLVRAIYARYPDTRVNSVFRY